MPLTAHVAPVPTPVVGTSAPSRGRQLRLQAAPALVAGVLTLGRRRSLRCRAEGKNGQKSLGTRSEW